MRLPSTESEKALRALIDEIIVPSLIWRAGRNAESLRTIAAQCLVSMAENAEEECSHIFTGIIPHLTSLAEDNCAVTRAYAMRCLLSCGPLDFDDFKQALEGLSAEMGSKLG